MDFCLPQENLNGKGGKMLLSLLNMEYLELGMVNPSIFYKKFKVNITSYLGRKRVCVFYKGKIKNDEEVINKKINS